MLPSMKGLVIIHFYRENEWQRIACRLCKETEPKQTKWQMEEVHIHQQHQTHRHKSLVGGGDVLPHERKEGKHNKQGLLLCFIIFSGVHLMLDTGRHISSCKESNTRFKHSSPPVLPPLGRYEAGGMQRGVSDRGRG